MRTRLALLVTLGFIGIANFVSAATASRPNVLVIVSDDQGYGDFSCHGNPILKTPNLDRLHDQSVRFTDFHVAPVCTPTRGQLMTGQDALRNGAHTVPAGHNLIWREIPVLPEMLRGGGYRTGLFGKWHLGDVWPDRPMDRGFDRAVWFTGHGIASSTEFDNDCVKVRYRDQLVTKRSDQYCTDLWFGEAMKWMEQQQTEHRPFFCYLATNAPHSPCWIEEKDAARYRGKVPPQAANFFGMIANFDDNLGRLLDWMQRTQLERDTIIVFFNDNGGTAGTRIYKAGLREGKGSNYDGGHRAACFMRWPGGKFTAPRDVATPAQVQDVLPTLLELTRVPAPAKARFDGTSLVPLLRSETAPLPDRMMVVQYGTRDRPVKNDGCVIWGQWRWVNGEGLYDIRADRAQAKNLSAQFPDVARRMRDHYEQWWSGLSRQFEYQPILLGTQQENPVQLNPNMWAGVDVDNPRRVAEAAGGPRGGPWNVEVTQGGDYVIELRRWPFHTDFALGSEGPSKTISGRPLNHQVKRTPVAAGVLAVGGREFSAKAAPTDLGVVIRTQLPAGRTKLQAWFRDAAGNDLCGAYYARVQRVGPNS